MAETSRLNTTIDAALANRLERETRGRSPQLPKRYVVELALRRLFDELDNGQLQLDLSKRSHGQ